MSAIAFLFAHPGAAQTLPAPIDPVSVIAPELRPYLNKFPTVDYDLERLKSRRLRGGGEEVPLPKGVVRTMISGAEGAPPIEVLTFDPLPEETGKPAFLFIHGGGYIFGSAADTAPRLAGYAQQCGCFVASANYRLSPETAFPGPLEDNFAALKWLHDNAATLGIDPQRIAIGGDSAGGGHAAQLAIAARDRGVSVVFQVLLEPMLDDRTGSTIDMPDHIGHYIWTEASNRFAWGAYLDQPAGSKAPPYGAVPARVKDLSGLPPAWIGVGSADLFMAESVAYAKRLAEAGVPVELLVIPGGYHAYYNIAPDAELSKQFYAAWGRALYRALHPGD